MSEPRNGRGQRGGLWIGWFGFERHTPRQVKEPATPRVGGSPSNVSKAPRCQNIRMKIKEMVNTRNNPGDYCDVAANSDAPRTLGGEKRRGHSVGTGVEVGRHKESLG